jgi:hypothetical protein
MMVALLLYAYAIGERSSRRIERRCVEDVATRVICANRAPDHTMIEEPEDGVAGPPQIFALRYATRLWGTGYVWCGPAEQREDSHARRRRQGHHQ